SGCGAFVGGPSQAVLHDDTKGTRMTPNIAPLTKRPAWQALQAHHRQIKDVHLRQLFADDPKRGERLTLDAVGLYLDYSKTRVAGEPLTLLVRPAEESALRQRIAAMSRGDKITAPETRAVLPVALRAPEGDPFVVDGEDVTPAVHAVLHKMTDFCNRVRG